MTTVPTAVLDIDLADPWAEQRVDDVHRAARVLVRLQRRPIGMITVPVDAGLVRGVAVVAAFTEAHAGVFAEPLARHAIATHVLPDAPDLSALFTAPAAHRPPMPLVTVAVCTRNRAPDLQRCLDALLQLDYPALELLVVDNAPDDRSTKDVVAARPAIRYVCEPRPGLDWARNRAVLEARGAIVAFTDDDVVVDRYWVRALADVFSADTGVAAVTGLVFPAQLETDAQHLFETYGGFARGFRRRWQRAPVGVPAALSVGGTGALGTGANMAFRRSVFDVIGGFDPALDVGTRTNGGGDLEMFFRVLKEGYALVYEPAAIVHHRHRRTYRELRTQIANNGIGFYAYLVRTAIRYRDERIAVLRLGIWWLAWWSLRRTIRALLGRELVPFDLILVELRGSLRGLFRYPRARREARAVADAHPNEPSLSDAPRARPTRVALERELVRTVDLSRPLRPIEDAGDYWRVHVVAMWDITILGRVTIDNFGAPISPAQIEDAVTARLAYEILSARTRLHPDHFWQAFNRRVREQASGASTIAPWPDLAAPIATDALPVTVVMATRDRPHDLRACLASLVRQRTRHRVEIIVVDNNPSTPATADVVREYPGVTLVNEPRGGLSYARNRGIAAATGRIIACTDDDVVCPEDWLERLLEPFAERDVMVVTGNVLPFELETRGQQLFEQYGGLGRGTVPMLTKPEWFAIRRRSLPTWELGCTANAAFRAEIFADDRIGLMDEALGAGTPTGCSEDTYVFYKVLKAGYRIAYEPRAYVWHRHRRDIAALRRQLYSYSTGHVAYHLTTWMNDSDRRGLVRLVYELPVLFARRFVLWALRRNDYPLRFILLELAGTVAGPVALWRSRRRVRKLGRSARFGSSSGSIQTT